MVSKAALKSQAMTAEIYLFAIPFRMLSTSLISMVSHEYPFQYAL